jgi:hypothetical protein
MSKDLSILTMIRLDTELENCIGKMTDAQRRNDFTEFLVYEQELQQIMNEIESLGE